MLDDMPNSTLWSSAGDLRLAALQVRDRFVEELEYELYPDQVPTKNKFVLNILELCLLGICGVDRCYMGQTCLGVLKGMTLGGLLVWFVIDWVVVVISSYTWSREIRLVGFTAEFDNGVGAAFWLTLSMTTMTTLILCFKSFFQPEPEDPEVQDDYAMFDKERSGYITKAMLKKVLLDNDVIITDEEVNALFKELDTENSGTVSIQALQRALLKK